MRSCRLGFILWLVLVCVFESEAQEPTNFYQLTKEACRSYPGDNPSHYISDLSRQYENPLAATELGQRVLKNSFSSGYSEYSYLNQEEFLSQIVRSKEFKKALDECYKEVALAKSFFIFFLHQLDLQGKTSAFTVDTASFISGGFLIAKISSFVVRQLAWTEKVFKWAGRTMILTIGATITLVTGQTIYKMVRQYQESLSSSEKQNLRNKALTNPYEQATEETIQSIDAQILELRTDLKNIKIEDEKVELTKLLRELEILVSHLRQQKHELQKKLAPAP